MHRNAARTTELAGRHGLGVFPYGTIPSKITGNDQGDLAGLFHQVADHAALSQFGFPDLSPEIHHGAASFLLFLERRLRNQQPPLTAIQQLRPEFRTVNLLQKQGHTRFQPCPVVVIYVHEFGIMFTERCLPAPKKYLAAHHTHARSVSEHLFGIVRVHAANNRDSARHELGKRVARRTQYP